MSSELVKHAECTKASPHKGRRPSAASTEGGRRLRRRPPSVVPFVGACFRTFGVFDKLRRHQDPSKCIKIHANPSIQSGPDPIGPILGPMGPLYGGSISFCGTPLLHISFCGPKIDTPTYTFTVVILGFPRIPLGISTLAQHLLCKMAADIYWEH